MVGELENVRKFNYITLLKILVSDLLGWSSVYYKYYLNTFSPLHKQIICSSPGS